MHGVKRNFEKCKEDMQRIKEKIIQYRKLSSLVLKNKIKSDFSKTALDNSIKLLEQNPDFYIVWNYRKEYVESFQNTDKLFNDVLLNELEISLKALSLNPKSYSSWYHRKWILERFFPEIPNHILEKELKLTQLLFEIDNRNFHCWTHRRFLINLIGKSTKSSFSELEFISKMLQRNFSNYSAWHYRAIILSQNNLIRNHKKNLLKEEKLNEKIEFKENEFKLIEKIAKELDFALSALYTDPDDSSAWLYVFWIFSFSACIENSFKPFFSKKEKKIKNPISNLNWSFNLSENAKEKLYLVVQLIEKEVNDSKWTILAIVFLSKIGLLNHFSVKQIKEKIKKLMKIDPLRKKLYLKMKEYWD